MHQKRQMSLELGGVAELMIILFGFISTSDSAVITHICVMLLSYFINLYLSWRPFVLYYLSPTAAVCESIYSTQNAE